MVITVWLFSLRLIDNVELVFSSLAKASRVDRMTEAKASIVVSKAGDTFKDAKKFWKLASIAAIAFVTSWSRPVPD
jgi:hypothetical protein